MQEQETIKQKKPRKGIWSWIKELLIFVLLFLVISWGVDIWRSQSMASGMAPPLTTTTVSGEQIDLLTMSQDKPVLVYFWATWCGVCSAVSPSVDYLAGDHQVVTIALTSGTDKIIEQYLGAKQYTFNTINDPKGVIAKQWGISATPTLFVIDKGEVRSVTTGFTSPMGMWLRLKLAG